MVTYWVAPHGYYVASVSRLLLMSKAYLQKRTNQALKGALTTVLGEWRLMCVSFIGSPLTTITYALRILDMLHHHNQLFFHNETEETRVPVIVWLDWEDLRAVSDPTNILGLWEELLHENLLAGKLDINVAMPQSTNSTAVSIELELVDSTDGSIERFEFDVAV